MSKPKRNRYLSEDPEDKPKFSKNSRNDHRRKEKEHAPRDGQWQEKEFRCDHCHLPVLSERQLAGVNNRNHCPFCLWSKHVDLRKAGDRKAACHARMEPIGLTFKATRKKYNLENHGELMVIHRCTGCGKISINRIAADDSAGALSELYRCSCELTAEIISDLRHSGIEPLGPADLTEAFSQLFGWQPILQQFEPEISLSIQPEPIRKELLES